MAWVKVEVRPLTLSLNRGTNDVIARRTVNLLKQQAAANKSGTGAPLGTKKDGSPVTLDASGELWSKVDFRETPTECITTFNAPHASYVFERYKDSDRLSPQYQKQLDNECATLIEKNVTLTEGDSVKEG